MAAQLPNGALIYIAGSYGDKVTITAISNASPAVVTAASHGLSKGDYVEITSGWNKLNECVYRVGETTTGTFELEGVDTTDTSKFPAGTGAGSFREIASWTQIQQITETSTDGGDAEYTEYEYLEDDYKRRIPTGYSAMSINLTIADDPSLPGYKVLKTAKTTRNLHAIKMQLPNASELLYNGYVSLNETPTTTKGEIMTVSASLSLTTQPVRY